MPSVHYKLATTELYVERSELKQCSLEMATVGQSGHSKLATPELYVESSERKQCPL